MLVGVYARDCRCLWKGQKPGICGAEVTGGLKFSSVLGTELSLQLILFILSKIMFFFYLFTFVHVCVHM